MTEGREGPGAGVCRACGKPNLTTFYEVAGVPTQSCVLLDDPQQAIDYPVGEISLAVCEECGFIQNSLFRSDLVDYSVPTEESQAYSPRFRQFSDSLARDLWERFRLEDKTVLEVGCGKGDFLVSLARLGVGRATGIDPGFMTDRAAPEVAGITFVRDWYDERYVGLTGDLILARHVLEHIPEVLHFTSLLVSSIDATAGSSLFVELPDVRRVLEEGAFWDIYYEHCSYFTLGSLGSLLRRTGLEPTRLSLGFEDQYLLAEATRRDPSVGRLATEEPVEVVLAAVEYFSETSSAATERWRERLSDLSSRGGRIALWGGGSKAVAFLSTVPMEEGAVSVVDINPHKQGKYLPGTAIEVRSPEDLPEESPDLVVVMNPIYRSEIAGHLEGLDLSPALMTIVD